MLDRPEVIDALVILYTVLRAFLLLTIAPFLLLKALVFRRAGKFGQGLANSNIAVAIAYLGSLLLLIGLDFFRTWPWILGISIGVGVWVTRAAIAMAELYGGWKNLIQEAKAALHEFREEWKLQHPIIRFSQLLIFLEFWAAVVLVEVKGTPREWIIPTMLVEKQTPTPEPSPQAGLSYPGILPSPTPLITVREEPQEESLMFVPVGTPRPFDWHGTGADPCRNPLYYQGELTNVDGQKYGMGQSWIVVLPGSRSLTYCSNITSGGPV